MGSSSVWTVDYQVPLTGSSELPTMTAKEKAMWGQTDEPAEAMAMFPPDTVMGWPAKDYKRATVYYLDSEGRTVNVCPPTGGISTTEYNAYNDVTRTLSPDNRATALKEGSNQNRDRRDANLRKSRNCSRHENTYEEKGKEPGTELLSTLGPQHTVELASAKEAKSEEVRARTHELLLQRRRPHGRRPLPSRDKDHARAL